MITLNSEQGLITVDNWEDVISRPGFINNLNPSDHILDSIIGRYMFKDMIKCGLSNCHSPHSKGYLVKTKEGLSTNIGKDCGKKYFSVDFEFMTKQFDRDITEQENRSRLFSFSFQIEELEKKITDIRDGYRGADWIYKKTRALVSIENGCPTDIVRKITSMIKAGSSALSISREATKAEVDALSAMQNRNLQTPHIVEETIAHIDGMQALYPDNDLKSLLVLNLQKNLTAFKLKDIDILSYEDLRHWTKWVGSMERKLEKALDVVKYGNALLTQLNLEPFNQVLSNDDEKKIFKAYLKGLQG